MLTFISSAAIPAIICLIILHGLSKNRDVYQDFIDGAKEGLPLVLKIMPTLIGLMMSVGILRASGCFDYLTRFSSYLLQYFHFPAELLPLSIIKMFSSSAATGLLLDLYQTYGPDSFLGTAASIMLSSTETIFYTLSVYFMSIHIKKTRWTLWGALTATVAGIAASVILAGWN